MASNERVLQSGLGVRSELREVRVEWPSGAVSRMMAPDVDGTFLIVEGMPSVLRRQNGEAHSFPVEVFSPQSE